MKRWSLVGLTLLVGCAAAASQDVTLGWPGDGIEGRVKVWASPRGLAAQTGPSCDPQGGAPIKVLARNVELAEVEVIGGDRVGCHGYVPLTQIVNHNPSPGLSGTIDEWLPTQFLGMRDGQVRPVFVSQAAAEQVEQAQLIRHPEWRVTAKELSDPRLESLLACLPQGGDPVDLLVSGRYTVAIEVVAGDAKGCRGVVFRHQLFIGNAPASVWKSGEAPPEG